MSDLLNWKLASALSAACISGLVVGKILSRSQDSGIIPKNVPKNWIKVGNVSRLVLYPIKSCQGVDVDKAYATVLGLKATEYLRDRVFLVVDSRGVFQTQRTVPRLVLISVKIEGNKVTLSADGKESVTFTVPDDKPENRRDCRVFADEIKHALDCGDAVGKWLDEFLGLQGLRIYYHSITDKTQREMTGLQKKFPTFLPTDKAAFHDQTSLMVMCEESVDELNKHLDNPVTYKNFRPTIMIKGIQEAYDEDHWTFVKIGKNGPVFKTSKPCTRCKLTTVNPHDGTFRADGEPLKTLNKMRRTFVNEKVNDLVKREAVMGVQLGLFGDLTQSLEVHNGDPVFVAAL